MDVDVFLKTYPETNLVLEKAKEKIYDLIDDLQKLKINNRNLISCVIIDLDAKKIDIGWNLQK